MKGILLLNGSPYTGKIDDNNAIVLCCDGAYAWAKNKVKITENVGDFDSLAETPYPAPLQVYPSEKDLTDGEIALRKLLAYGCDSIEIYGGGGGREDHFAGNLHLLYYAQQHGVKAKMINKKAVLFAASGPTRFRTERGQTISLLPFGGEAHIIGGEGWKYPLDGVTLTYGVCRGLSNIATEDEAAFICDSGAVLVCVNLF